MLEDLPSGGPQAHRVFKHPQVGPADVNQTLVSVAQPAGFIKELSL